eukprot:CAMPEP_0119288744 /NCGR_PEP_ID=MMETSP1329-20130426/37807_1 /TAXON_ID=114041 /ORGANISM="Genus nov. species nov., Strain RCC1024" /LENGTH=169 /DNA_ID=CAMNT_0007289527 /DNA_START=245 /DNA_END=750 /DNA_ORIENTATION=+
MATPPPPPERATEVFVQNEKGTEYVGSVSCEAVPLPPQLTFDDYTRTPEVLNASAWPERAEWRARLVGLTPTAGKIDGFAAFLASRKKAAVATVCDEAGEATQIIALLPSSPDPSIQGLAAACFFDPSPRAAKRARDEGAEGFETFRHVDLVSPEARAAAVAALPAWQG